jgi:hypothetical protein
MNILYITKTWKCKLAILYKKTWRIFLKWSGVTVYGVSEFIAKAQFIFNVISLFEELQESRLVSLPLPLLPVFVAQKQANDDKD